MDGITLVEFLPQQVFALLFIFARIGSALAFMPAIGEAFVLPSTRLILGLGISTVLLPIVPVPPLPSQPSILFIIILGEVLAGVFLALVARFILSALDVAGMVIGMQSGLANAFVLNPSVTEQSAVISTFLIITGVVLIMITDLHHLGLIALVDSYAIFSVREAIPIGDMANTLAQTMNAAFKLAFHIAAPVIMLGLVYNIGLGLLARLIPQVQVFFIMMPLQIGLGVLTLTMSIGGIIYFFLERYSETIQGLIGF